MFSRIEHKEVIGNTCPFCGYYQGNAYVENTYGTNYPGMAEYVVGFLDVPFRCLTCGKQLEEEPLERSAQSYFHRIEEYKIYLECKDDENEKAYSNDGFHCKTNCEASSTEQTQTS